MAAFRWSATHRCWFNVSAVGTHTALTIQSLVDWWLVSWIVSKRLDASRLYTWRRGSSQPRCLSGVDVVLYIVFDYDSCGGLQTTLVARKHLKTWILLDFTDLSMHSADHAVARCLSVRPSVCVSVTRRYSVKTVTHPQTFLPSGSHTILDSHAKRYSNSTTATP